MAVASAPPSFGSVPVPTSSSSTSAGNASSRSIDTMLAMCPENVLRLAAIDCSSPMSAKTERNTGSVAAAAGTCSPACAISASRPAVLIATVLPPVLGPVISRTRVGGSITMSVGTTSAGPAAKSPPSASSSRSRTARISSGCRAARSSRRPSIATSGATPLTSDPKRDFACSVSRSMATPSEASTSSGRARNASVNASRMRRTSSRSRSSISTMSLLISTVADGSRNRLAPLADPPWTMPGTLPRCSVRTIST